jgi:hypothetical protein
MKECLAVFYYILTKKKKITCWDIFLSLTQDHGMQHLAGHTERNKFVHAIKKHQGHRATPFLQRVYSNEVHISTLVEHALHRRTPNIMIKDVTHTLRM